MALATRSWHNKEPIVVVVLFVAGVAHAKCGQRHDAKEPAVRTQSSSCLKTLKKKTIKKDLYFIWLSQMWCGFYSAIVKSYIFFLGIFVFTPLNVNPLKKGWYWFQCNCAWPSFPLSGYKAFLTVLLTHATLVLECCRRCRHHSGLCNYASRISTTNRHHRAAFN